MLEKNLAQLLWVNVELGITLINSDIDKTKVKSEYIDYFYKNIKEVDFFFMGCLIVYFECNYVTVKVNCIHPDERGDCISFYTNNTTKKFRRELNNVNLNNGDFEFTQFAEVFNKLLSELFDFLIET